jgi:hypothetical protein
LVERQSGTGIAPVGGNGMGQGMDLHSSSPVIVAAAGAHPIVTAATTATAGSFIGFAFPG